MQWLDLFCTYTKLYCTNLDFFCPWSLYYSIDPERKKEKRKRERQHEQDCRWFFLWRNKTATARRETRHMKRHTKWYMTWHMKRDMKTQTEIHRDAVDAQLWLACTAACPLSLGKPVEWNILRLLGQAMVIPWYPLWEHFPSNLRFTCHSPCWH